jgi:hypothetical protein
MHDDGGPLRGALYYRLFEEAERVRWRMADIPWAELEPRSASQGLVALVRAIAHSELTTFSATRRFMADFADDIDFSQWLAIWFYEETKHPQVLMRWLSRFGERFDELTMVRARATAPFMKSRMGTLVMNVISEMVASARYLALSKHAREPVLRMIARNLAADEARHATHFHAYAKKLLASSPSPDSERMAAVKVLYFWLCESEKVQHPVSLLYDRAENDPDLAPLMDEMPLEMERVDRKICTLIGRLVGRRMDTRGDIKPALHELVAAVRAAGALTTLEQP